MEFDRNITFSIETAIEGGSLALLDGQVEINSWSGENGISQAEVILEQISKLFHSSGLDKKQIKLITAASGAGSLTGLKIGLAIAKGLGKSLNCPVAEVSISKALAVFAAQQYSDQEGKILVILPFGQTRCCRQIFENGKSNIPAEISDWQSFIAGLNYSEYKRIIFNQTIAGKFENLTENPPEKNDKCRLINVGSNLALYIGRLKSSNASDNNIN